eukprot:1468219-Rhodomonas_salina.1
MNKDGEEDGSLPATSQTQIHLHRQHQQKEGAKGRNERKGEHESMARKESRNTSEVYSISGTSTSFASVHGTSDPTVPTCPARLRHHRLISREHSFPLAHKTLRSQISKDQACALGLRMTGCGRPYIPDA